jgi:hypothetical protein
LFYSGIINLWRPITTLYASFYYWMVNLWMLITALCESSTYLCEQSDKIHIIFGFTKVLVKMWSIIFCFSGVA